MELVPMVVDSYYDYLPLALALVVASWSFPPSTTLPSSFLHVPAVVPILRGPIIPSFPHYYYYYHSPTHLSPYHLS